MESDNLQDIADDPGGVPPLQDPAAAQELRRRKRAPGQKGRDRCEEGAEGRPRLRKNISRTRKRVHEQGNRPEELRPLHETPAGTVRGVALERISNGGKGRQKRREAPRVRGPTPGGVRRKPAAGHRREASGETDRAKAMRV